MASTKENSVAELTEVDESIETAAVKLQGWFSDLAGSDEDVEIYERDGRQLSYLFATTADEYTPAALFDVVLELYGPGTYEAMHRERGAIKHRTCFKVGSGKKKRGPRRLPGGVDEDNKPGAPPTMTDDRVLAAIQATNESVRALAEAMSRRDPPKTTIETLQELATFKELFAPASTPMDSMINMFRDMLEIKSTLLEGDAPDPLTAAIRTLGPAITGAVDEMRKRENSRVARLHAEAERTPNPTPESDEGEDVNFFQRATITAYLPHILQYAEQGVAPEQAAQHIAGTLAQFPADQLTAVVEWLDNTQVIDELEAIEPKCKPHRKWLDKTIDAVLLIFYPPDGDGDGDDSGDDDAAAVDSAKPTNGAAKGAATT